MNQEVCPTCGKGTLIVTTKRPDGYVQKKYSCGHIMHQMILVEIIKLSDSEDLAKRISGSFANLSGSVSVASGLANTIPREKLEELGITESILKYLKNIENNTKSLTEQLTNIGQPNVIIWGNITAPIQVSQQGNNILISTDIEKSFNQINQEIDRTNIDSSTKIRIKSEIDELKKEIGKEKPDKSKILKIWDEVKTLAPFLVSLKQLYLIISKLLLG